MQIQALSISVWIGTARAKSVRWRAVLRRVAERAAKPIASAALFEPLPALPDFLFDPSP
jgi:hypothetical protein